MENYAVIILAAGESDRMGQPKQLLPYLETTLLEHAIETAGSLAVAEVCIVLGSGAETILPIIANASENIIINKDWKTGMSSTIKCGLQYILNKYPATDGIIFMTCDQPYITKENLNEMIVMHRENGKTIIAASYADTIGIPVLFGGRFFSELMKLNGDKGAKQIIQKYHDEVAEILIPRAAIDIDTPEQFQALKVRPFD